MYVKAAHRMLVKLTPGVGLTASWGKKRSEEMPRSAHTHTHTHTQKKNKIERIK